jgi:anti-sigma B factor antagonist
LERPHPERGPFHEPPPRTGPSTNDGPAPALSIHVHEENGVSTVALRGELDLWETETVQKAVAAISNGDVALDLSDLTFLDAAGVSAILAARRIVTERGSRFTIMGAKSLVRTVFEVTDLARLLGD